MIWSIYDFTDTRNESVIQKWADDIRLPERERGRLDLKVDMLSKNGETLSHQLLAGTKSKHIKKIKVKGNIQLRPLLCRGPISMEQEFTFLLGAVERDWELEPKDALKRAEDNRQVLLRDHTRRTEYEPLSRKIEEEPEEE